jgi:hypothetical protein
MEKEVSFKAKIKQIGDSNWILLPKPYLDEIEAYTGDYVDITLTKTLKVVNSYICLLCSSHFDSDDDEPYCPICEAEREDLKIELKGGEE